jgi:hypothetical protein
MDHQSFSVKSLHLNAAASRNPQIPIRPAPANVAKAHKLKESDIRRSLEEFPDATEATPSNRCEAPRLTERHAEACFPYILHPMVYLGDKDGA